MNNKLTDLLQDSSGTPGALSVTRVMLVDDAPKFIAGMQSALASSPDLTCIGTARTVATARLQVERLAPDVVVDMELGGHPLAGVAVIAHVREVLPDCEPLAVTVFDDISMVLAAVRAGASGIVHKVHTAEDLCSQIRVLRGGGSPISPSIARLLLKHLSGNAVAGYAAGASDGTALSANEVQMLRFATKGFTHDEIARHMGVSRNTVLTYAKRCYRKLQVHSRTEAIYEARRMGWLPD